MPPFISDICWKRLKGLALQKDHTSVKSQTLSSLLQVSDSCRKKLLAKMVKADLITSNIGCFEEHPGNRFSEAFMAVKSEAPL